MFISAKDPIDSTFNQMMTPHEASLGCSSNLGIVVSLSRSSAAVAKNQNGFAKGVFLLLACLQSLARYDCVLCTVLMLLMPGDQGAAGLQILAALPLCQGLGCRGLPQQCHRYCAEVLQAVWFLRGGRASLQGLAGAVAPCQGQSSTAHDVMLP